MENKLSKVRLKRNESFNIREGWLRKGMKLLPDYPNLFSLEEAMQLLGVGSKMVKSIKYWLLTTGLAEEKKVKSKIELVITEELGEVINQYDPYFEDLFTLYILHVNIASNIDNATIWYLFFNKYDAKTITKEDMQNVLDNELKKILNKDVTYSDSLFRDDCGNVIKMYADDEDNNDPEDNLSSPLSALGLLVKSQTKKGTFEKTAPRYDKLDCLVILYIMLRNKIEGKDSVSINDLLTGENSAGKLLNLTRPRLNEYLDQLRARGYITINRTAGLDMVYFDKDITAKQVLIDYYTQEERL